MAGWDWGVCESSTNHLTVFDEALYTYFGKSAAPLHLIRGAYDSLQMHMQKSKPCLWTSVPSGGEE